MPPLVTGQSSRNDGCEMKEGSFRKPTALGEQN